LICSNAIFFSFFTFCDSKLNSYDLELSKLWRAQWFSTMFSDKIARLQEAENMARLEDKYLIEMSKQDNLLKAYGTLLRSLNTLYYFLLFIALIISVVIHLTAPFSKSHVQHFKSSLGFRRHLNMSFHIQDYEKKSAILEDTSSSIPDAESMPTKSPVNNLDLIPEDSIPTPSTESITEDSSAESNTFDSLGLTTEEWKALNLTVENLDFVHIAKNGGTSLENFGLYHLRKKWGRKKRFKTRGKVKTDEGMSCRFPWHVPPRLFKYKAYPLRWSFCAIRNPFTRVVSEFNFHQLHGGNPGNGGVKFYDQYNLTADGLNEWIQWVFKFYAKPKKKFIYDCHLIPQSEFIFDFDGSRTCHFVLKLENIDHDFEEFSKVFHFHDRYLENNGLTHDNHSKKKLDKKITADDISEENKKFLREFYKDDFALYDSPGDFKFFDMESNWIPRGKPMEWGSGTEAE